MAQDNQSPIHGKHARVSPAEERTRPLNTVKNPGARSAASPNIRTAGYAQGNYRPTYPAMPPQKKKSKAKTVLLVILAVVLVALIGVGVAVALYLNSINGAISNKDELEAQQVKEALQAPKESSNANEKDAFYMLVLGSDARDVTQASRSDVIILTRVVPSEKKVTMVSIPRDTKVEIPGHGTQKINAAYAFDGASGAIDAVSNFAGVPITHYAEIHFKEMEELVDKLGGVWVDIPYANDQTGYYTSTSPHIEAGNQLLSGAEALAFARERYGYARGDFQRADNQRLVATAIMKQVLSKPAPELPGIVQDLASTVTTDLSATDLIGLARQFQGEGLTVYSALAPSSTATIDGVSYAISDEAGWQAMMEKIDKGENPSAEG